MSNIEKNIEKVLETHDIDICQERPGVYLVRIWHDGDPIVEVTSRGLAHSIHLARRYLEAMCEN